MLCEHRICCLGLYRCNRRYHGWPEHWVKYYLLESESLLVANHRVSLSCSGGTVGEYCGIEAIQDSSDERMGSFEIDLNATLGTFSLV